jgi:hypothetical protein
MASLFDYDYCAVCFDPLHDDGPCEAHDCYITGCQVCGCTESVSEEERGAKVIVVDQAALAFDSYMESIWPIA